MLQAKPLTQKPRSERSEHRMEVPEVPGDRCLPQIWKENCLEAPGRINKGRKAKEMVFCPILQKWKTWRQKLISNQWNTNGIYECPSGLKSECNWRQITGAKPSPSAHPPFTVRTAQAGCLDSSPHQSNIFKHVSPKEACILIYELYAYATVLIHVYV